MLNFLKRKFSSADKQPIGYLHPDQLIAETGEQLLANNEIHLTISRIRRLAGVSDEFWYNFYYKMFCNYAEFVQKLPASEAHHHCYEGGLLKHGLEAVYEILRLRSGLMLPQGADAETLDKLKAVWTYACATAALLHDLGKPITDQEIIIQKQGGQKETWQPFISNIPVGSIYTPKFRIGRQYHQHAKISPLIAHKILPAEGLEWLSSNAELMDYWLNAIQGELEEGGILSDLVIKADQASVAQDLAGGSRVQLTTARAKPLSHKLLQTLRHLLKEHALPTNRKGAAVFITDTSLWLVSKRVLDAIRDQMHKDGQTGVPSDNKRLMDELQQHHVIQADGDKAIWKCQVIEGDWSIELTLLKMDLNKVWPNHEERPQPWEGKVIPLNAAATENEKATPQETLQEAAPIGATPTPETNKQEQPAATETKATTPAPEVKNQEAATEIKIEPKEALDDDGLILPYDLPVASEQQEAATDTNLPSQPPQQAENEPEENLEDEEFTPTHTNEFLAWLQTVISRGRNEINTKNARIHVVEEGLFLISPGIFKDFNLEQYSSVQKRFLKLRLHQRRPDGTNIWSAAVEKPEVGRRTSIIKGILIPEAEAKLEIKLPPPNPVLRIIKYDKPN